MNQDAFGNFIPLSSLLVGDNTSAWLISDEIANGLNLLSGPRNAGKTTLAIDYALRVARKYPVLFAAQNNEDNLQDQCDAWVRQFDRGEGRLFFYFGEVNFLDKEQSKDFYLDASALNPKLIIFELGSVSNEIRELKATINTLREMQHNTGAAILLVCDNSHVSADSLTFLVEACDNALSLRYEENNRSLLTTIRTIPNIAFAPAPRFIHITGVELDETRYGYVANRSQRPLKTSRIRSERSLNKDVELLSAIADAGEAGINLPILSEKVQVPIATLYGIVRRYKERSLVKQAGYGAPIVITAQGLEDLETLQTGLSTSAPTKATS